jgi:hypothetical protein
MLPRHLIVADHCRCRCTPAPSHHVATVPARQTPRRRAGWWHGHRTALSSPSAYGAAPLLLPAFLSKPCLCACLSCVTTLPPSFPAPRRAMPGSLTLRSRRTLTPPSPPHRYVHGVEERMPPEESSVTVAWCATWRGSDARMRPVRACVCRVTCMATHGLNPNKQWRRTHHRSLRRSAGTG